MNITFNEFQNITSDNGDPEMANNLGQLAEKHNDLKSAISHYSNAISFDKTFSDAYFNRARCFTELKQFDKSIDDYETLNDFHTDKDLIKSLIGNVYCEIGNYDTALKYQNEAIDLNPNRADNYYYRGISKLKMNKIEGALFDFEYSLKLNPNQEKTLFQIGQLKRQTRDYQSAFEAFDKLFHLAPLNGHNLYNRGLINYSLKKFEESLNDLLEAHKLGVVQATEEVVKLFINRYISNKQVSEAINMFKHLIDTTSTRNTLSFLYCELAKFELKSGDFGNAFNSINNSIEHNQINPIAYELRGMINMRLERFDNAIEDFNKVKSIDVNYYNNSANILLSLPSLNEAMTFEEKITLTERAIQLEPHYEIAYYNLGYFYKKAKNLDKAIEAFKKAHEIAPTSIDNIREICNCLLEQMDLLNLKVYSEKGAALADENATKNLKNLNHFFKQQR